MDNRDLNKNYQALAHAIIAQAALDYRMYKGCGKRVSHISKFFKSRWCNQLLGSSTLTGNDILNRLKSETVAKIII